MSKEKKSNKETKKAPAEVASKKQSAYQLGKGSSSSDLSTPVKKK
ncbi:hypothetical protein [Mucilaginibacter pallidiroseus]|nr:hypothetical protein [Mucilaginibacter pallidiroseus]